MDSILILCLTISDTLAWANRNMVGIAGILLAIYAAKNIRLF